MKRAVLLGLLLFAGLPGKASALPALTTSGTAHFPYYIWVAEAKVPVPEMPLTITEASPLDCATTDDSITGCTDGIANIQLDPLQPYVRFTFLHELGHIYASQRPELGFALDDEWFANTYAGCAMGYRNAFKVVRRTCRAIRRP